MQNDSPDTLPRILAHAAHVFGDKPALVDGDVRLSFTALQQQVWQAAAAFLSAGVAPGGRVAIWAPNGWRWVVACLGAQSVGASLVPLNTRLKGEEAAYILRRSGAAMLVAQGEFLGIDQAALVHGQALPDLRRVIRFDRDWDDFVAGGGDVAAARATADSVTACQASDILFTSGTTGQPKGVVATHGQTISVFRIWAERVGLCADDRYLIVNPFFHTFGYKAGWLACLLTGATAYPMATFDVAACARLIEREQITVLPGPPSIFISLLQDAALARTAWRKLASLRVAVTGAATVTPDLITRMRGDLGIGTVLTGYGLTESCGVVTMSQAGDDAETVAHSCGRAIPGVELRITGPDGAAAEIGEEGEILVRGYNVMAGYFEDEHATRAAIDIEGWLHTGDIGCLDGRGYLRITDRLTDMYISGGFNCYPAEIERMLAGHPDLAQVAVIGVPDARLGEVGIAYAVAKTGAAPSAQDVTAWARTVMANYKVPRAIKFVAGLPVNASGKILKTELRKACEP